MVGIERCAAEQPRSLLSSFPNNWHPGRKASKKASKKRPVDHFCSLLDSIASLPLKSQAFVCMPARRLTLNDACARITAHPKANEQGGV
jgi:hypothetical protein